MINASQEFKNLINSGVKVVNYADITLRNGTVLNLTPEDFALGGFSMMDEMTDGKFGVGYAVGKTIDVTIANHTNKFSSYDFYKSIIYMYVAVELEDGRVLKERKGKYYVINPTSPGDTIRLSGVDSMYLLDKPYKATTSYPATLQRILSDCCLDCGVNIGFSRFDNYNFVVTNRPEDVTYRDVVSYVAQIAGCNARINNNDALELVWYDVLFMGIDILDGGNLIQYDEADTYDGGDFSNYSNAVLFDGGNFTDPAPENVTKINSLSVSTDEIIISGIKLENDDVEILKGTEDYVIYINDNPLTIGKEEEIATYLYNKLKGYKFRALSCNIANNPLFESYDACYVYDRKGNYYFTLINSVQYKISGFTTIACKAEDPVRNESSYTSDAAKALVQAKRNTGMQLSNYDKAVQNMNMLAANAMGLYRESEKQSDGSEIYYQSNRPITKNDSGKCIFERNAVVYKMTANGFFVSTDGGKSFTAGFDSNGNAVMNVLAAIGITFDWARGGELALGGDGNINGKLIVYDGQGKQVGKWDKDGILLPPGTKIEWSQVSGTENVAKKNEIPKKLSQLSNDSGFTTSIDVNSIITGTVTASFINALKIKAGSVDAEDIIGTVIKGKQLKGGSISIGNKFTVDSNGNVIANSLESNNATITGGSIDIESSFNTSSKIILRSSEGSIHIRPSGINFSDIWDYGTRIDLDSVKVGLLAGTHSELTYNALNFSSGNDTSAKFSSNGIDFNWGNYNQYQGNLKTSYVNVNFENGSFKVNISGFNIDSGGTYGIDTSKDVRFSGSATFGGGVTISSGYGNYLTVHCDSNFNGNCKIGSDTYDKIGFFGSSGSAKKTVSAIYSTSSANASDCASKINEVINTLKGYGLL